MAGNARFSFNPVWVVDALGLIGLGGFGWAVSAAPDIWAGPAREAGLLLAGCAVVVRALDAVVRRRDRRGEARRELLRRLAALDEALRDLRIALSRDAARRFFDRRAEFAAALPAAQAWLSREEARLVTAGDAFCEDLADWLDGTVVARAGITALADRLRREIDRAAARGDLDPDEAESLADFVRDAVAVMDEAVYAEWNIDHLGRLTANRRHFGRIVERWSEPAVAEIERHGEALFEALTEHVGRKIELVDRLVAWDLGFRRLEGRLAGLKTRRPAPRPAAAPARLADRFVAGPVAGAPVNDEIPPVRLPAAAND
jgi:hypothetical protein